MIHRWSVVIPVCVCVCVLSCVVVRCRWMNTVIIYRCTVIIWLINDESTSECQYVSSSVIISNIESHERLSYYHQMLEQERDRVGNSRGLQVVVYESSYFRFSSENLENARASPITTRCRVFFHLQLLPDSMSIYPRLSSNECICTSVQHRTNATAKRCGRSV